MSFPISYEIIYSKRKSVAIQIRPDGQVIVRAPYGCPRSFINSFIHQKADWIVKHSAENKQRYEKQVQLKKDRPTLSDAQRKRYIETARSIFTQKAAYYARLIGVTYGRISIREQKTRWGSCSSKGNLNFNCLLMLAPPEVLDYVVVHELCHRKQMNHSKAFRAEVEKVFPDYKKSIIPYLVGTILLVTIGTIIRIINNLTTQAMGD